ncbi:uncharacterized protein DFL_009266 [Arthrobotrys flagrans]|uniref:Uncharacterized protein n=1 Tax=Arthrobotrys flagrans TaxID=97331 RepID=A0A436ZR51_ARTFL|nr:hypothetical protein DFL_009266 [Arthrobotrys flagrans]
MFKFKAHNLEFLWGRYRAFDLVGERNPRRILAQHAEENLSGTVVQRDSNPAAPDKPYKPPVRIMRVVKEGQFLPLTQTADINAVMRYAGETALLSKEEARTLQRARLLLGKIFRDIQEERARGTKFEGA